MHTDIVIITILTDCELPAVLRAFNIDPTKSPDRIHKGTRFWNTSINNKNIDVDLKVVITAIGEAGNSNSSAFTMEILKEYEPSLICLVGIAAGVHPNLSLGDVVISREVLGYETEKLLPEDVEGRPVHKEPPFSIRQDINHFQGLINKEEIEKKIRTQLEFFSKDSLPPQELIPVSRKVKPVTIASGEKLFGDGSLPTLANIYHDSRILAGEMEGIGFSISSDRGNCPWIIIRGISDFGDPTSKDGRYKDKFHNIASIAAAEVTKLFLEHGYSGSLKPFRGSSVNNVLQTIHPIKVRTILMTIHNKTGIEPLLLHFKNHNITIVATPNTSNFLKSLGYKPIVTFEFAKCTPISLSRGILHPYILAAIAADSHNIAHMQELHDLGINKIDLVFVNTKDPVFSDEADEAKLLDQLSDVQIGGPSLLRWTIKHWRTCAAVVDSGDYTTLLRNMEMNDNELSISTRLRLLSRALHYLSYKDSQTSQIFNALWPNTTWR